MSLMRMDHPSLLPKFSGVWEDLFGEDTPDRALWDQSFSTPAINIKEKGEEFEVRLAAPDMRREDFKIAVNNGMLSIASEQENEKKDDEEEYMRREFNYQSFHRAFTLPKNVNTEEVTANYKEGMLTIHLPKKATAPSQADEYIEVK